MDNFLKYIISDVRLLPTLQRIVNKSSAYIEECSILGIKGEKKKAQNVL